jgi:hypothetical protein
VNPNSYTYQREDGQTIDDIIEEDKIDQSVMDFVAQ